MKVSQGKSNAKIILMGEHSVVYGKSAISLPFFAAEVTAKVEEVSEGVEIISDYFSGPLDEAPSILNGVKELIDTVLKRLDMKSSGLKITLDSKIPAQRGFGSSAAVSVALSKALYNLVGQTLEPTALRELVEKAEKIHHENPSGLDGDTIVSQQAIYFIKNKNTSNIKINMDLDLIVGDTGNPASTKTAVQTVYNNENRDSEIEKLGQLSQAVFLNIKNQDSILMGKNMTQAHQSLKALGVSSDELDEFVDVAIESGALGAKLSGGGLGGCMIALSEKNKSQLIVDALKKQGADTIWILDLKEI